jgi:hypothetical protein
MPLRPRPQEGLSIVNNRKVAIEPETFKESAITLYPSLLFHFLSKVMTSSI